MLLNNRSSVTLTLQPGQREVIFFDDRVAGLGLRLRAGGSKTWIYRYRVGRVQRSIKLGNADSVPLVTARKNASQLEAEVRLGRDPQAQKTAARQEAEYTFGVMAERFLEVRRPELRQATFAEYRRYLMHDAKPLHRLPIAAVTQADIARLLNSATGPVAANRLRATLCTLLVWTMREGVILPFGNVAALTHLRSEQTRDRVLDDSEIKSIWAACEDDDFGHIVKLLFLTGCRREEIAGLRWTEVFADKIELPSERVKNKRKHTVALSKPAGAIIAKLDRGNRMHVFGRDDSGFFGWTKSKARVDHKIKIPPWRIHDIRRSVASGMQKLGIRVEVIERALNHASGSYRGVIGVYQRDPMTDEVRGALERWGQRVMAIVEGRKAVVVPMKRA